MEKFGHKVLEEVPDLKEELKSPTKMTGLEKVSPSLLWEYLIKIRRNKLHRSTNVIFNTFL